MEERARLLVNWSTKQREVQREDQKNLAIENNNNNNNSKNKKKRQPERIYE